MAFNSADTAAFKNVWVFCEQRQGVMMPTTFELISEGRKLANELGVELCGILLGDNVKGIAAELGQYGADKVYVYDSPLLKDFTTDAYTKVIVEAVEELKPEVLLFGASNIGLPRRSAPRRFPGQKRAVDIHMKNQPLHPLASFCSQYSISVRNLRTKNRKLANFYSVHTKRNAYAAGRSEVCSVPDSSIRFSAVLCANQMRFGLHLRTIPAGKAGGA